MNRQRILPAVVLLASILSAPAAADVVRSTRLPFIEDDYSRALTLAKSRGLPIFVEAWAPW